jgi:hypothetical protein
VIPIHIVRELRTHREIDIVVNGACKLPTAHILGIAREKGIVGALRVLAQHVHVRTLHDVLQKARELLFHLADLFHNSVLEMESAAEGRHSYEDVFKCLQEKAKEKGLERWLTTNLEDLSQ